MSSWDSDLYLKFGVERTRPAIDLAAQIRLQTPRTIVDLGCGPGNSTQVLRARWPTAHTVGVDMSAEMIGAARQSYPDQTWIQADLTKWTGDQPFDVVFSNAAIQWIGGHRELVQNLFGLVAGGGVLAFQIPSNVFALVRQHIHEIAADPAWNDRMDDARSALTMEPPSFYYDALVEHARTIDLWETEYFHVVENPESVVQWISGTGLRPFVDALESDEERQRFVGELKTRVARTYARRADGKVLFPFRRTFVIAYR
ncbi:MAG: methyltransferase domain-containing protein [Pirellulales bacterium]|nr:methyltransferase domain-containing protein [Pirellulales bacterium]